MGTLFYVCLDAIMVAGSIGLVGHSYRKRRIGWTFVWGAMLLLFVILLAVQILRLTMGIKA